MACEGGIPISEQLLTTPATRVSLMHVEQNDDDASREKGERTG